MIWTKIKATADAAASVVKSGCLLMWPQDDDGVISLKYKDSAGNIGTIAGGATDPIGDHISIAGGYWYLDGVSTGVAATGPKGDKGDAGVTGYVTTVISADQPQSPVDGTIWIKP